MKPPFALLEWGYKHDLENPKRFIHPDGHPFYPIEFKSEYPYPMRGDCIKAMLEAAFLEGTRIGFRGRELAPKVGMTPK